MKDITRIMSFSDLMMNNDYDDDGIVDLTEMMYSVNEGSVII